LIPLKKCKTFSFSLHSPFPPFGPTLLPKPSSAHSPPAYSQLRSPVQRSLLIAPRLSPGPRATRCSPAQQAPAAQLAHSPHAPLVEPATELGSRSGQTLTRRPRRLTPGPRVPRLGPPPYKAAATLRCEPPVAETLVAQRRPHPLPPPPLTEPSVASCRQAAASAPPSLGKGAAGGT
jgi:hypothetical protein